MRKKSLYNFGLDLENYSKQAKQGQVLTNYLVISADLDTPVSVYSKLKSKSPDAFIFESVIGGEKIGRYSLIGYKPIEKLVSKPSDEVDCYEVLEKKLIELNGSKELKVNNLLPFFYRGYVGFFSFESISWIEPSLKPKKADLPEMYLLLVGTLVVFDHVTQKIYLIDNRRHGKDGVILSERSEQRHCEEDKVRRGNPVNQKSPEDIKSLYEKSCSNILELKELIETNTDLDRLKLAQTEASVAAVDFKSNTGEAKFSELIAKAKEHIYEGDVFQVVISHKFYADLNINPLNVYRLLRTVNPSPYLFAFNFSSNGEDFSLVGSSPEMLVKGSLIEDSNSIEAEIRPIAGTYKRGDSLEQDLKLSEELLNDPKERAEHVMLIDLARNDLGRVCVQGSVTVPQNMIVEKYSHVLHIVSSVKGVLKKAYGVCSGIELLKASFPAGTLVGAPKVEALDIISKLELAPRGIYGGTIGYFGIDGTIDTAIMIRTLLLEKDRVTIQAGAGIVADSEPHKEWQETINKASALLKVCKLVQKD